MSPAHVRRGSVMPTGQRLKSRRTKATHKDRKSPRGILKLALLFLSCLLIVASVYLLFLSWQKKLWTTSDRFTVVVATKSPKIYSFNPVNGKLQVVVIPENAQISASNSYGNWLAGGLWEFGYQEGKKGELLRTSLQKTLTLPIDGWIESKGDDLFQGNALSWVSVFFKVLILGPSETNLTFFDKLSILMRVNSISTLERENLDLEKNKVIEKTKLTDGSDGYLISTEKAKIVMQQLHDDKVFAEAQRVIVVNTTSEPGLATNIASMVSTLGLRVVGTQSSDEKIQGCIVRGNSETLKTNSGRRIIKLFKCNEEVETLSGVEDLQLLLGSKFAEEY